MTISWPLSDSELRGTEGRSAFGSRGLSSKAWGAPGVVGVCGVAVVVCRKTGVAVAAALAFFSVEFFLLVL